MEKLTTFVSGAVRVVLGVAGPAVLLSTIWGCFSAVDTVQTATGLYGAAQAGSAMYHANEMVKSLEDETPVFQGYDRVRVEARVAPRGDDAEAVREAFRNNLAYLVAGELAAAELPAKVCLANCAGRVLTVQFVEEGYDDNLFQRLTMGGKLRGKVHYVDAADGSVVLTDVIESVETYADLAALVQTGIAMKVAKTLEAGGRDAEALARYMSGRVERPAVRPEYQDILERD